MGKTSDGATDSAPASPRSIPAVERILSDASFEPLIREFGRQQVKEALGRHLADLRSRRLPFDAQRAASSVRLDAAAAIHSSLRHVINGTGVIIHTNLGRAPIDPRTWEDARELVAGYSNLELDLENGERGARDEHLSAVCRTLFGCEAAVLTNNNAAAILLLLGALATERDVIVSRGELVEIGGGFRVPDIIQQGGARLREVGTTNRTRARDYADAITDATAAILRVHRSNFDIVGFTETPSVVDLVGIARERGVPLLYDEGSGRVVDLAKYGFERRETIAELIASGVGVVTCSTDKLLGATQGGLILGRAGLVERCRRHPLMRAVRAGKESYAVVGATLQSFAAGSYEERVPIYRMLAAPLEALRSRASGLVRGTDCLVIDSRCALGGGTTPAETIASIAIAVPGRAAETYQRFLRNEPPIIGRITEDRYTIDVRTLLDEDVTAVESALRATRNTER